ncbi:MAG: DUF1028 domain-containing protein [Planctomycetes bacterium]|nr:DUF1028 domain-containing protein [Planctomycetota bacterium]
MRIFGTISDWTWRHLRALTAGLLLASTAHATWSIVVVDTSTGEVCVATATCISGYDISNAVPVIVVGEGAAAAQSFIDQSGQNRTLIRDGLLAGDDPATILANLAATDSGHNTRQYGIVSLAGGPPVAFTGGGAMGAKKQVVGEAGTLRYAIQGNALAGQLVIDAAEDALLEAEGDLVTRVMASMQAARFMGGDGRCSCSQLMPASCGAPPPSFEHSAYTACIMVARAGDTDGACSAGGCAEGNYFLREAVTGTIIHPDPVQTLDRLVMDWRRSKRGEPDHILSEVSPAASRLPADGVTTTEVTIQLRDIEGEPLTEGGQNLSITDVSEGGPFADLIHQEDHGDGSHTLTFTSSTTPGTARFQVEVTHWWEVTRLYPDLELSVDAPTELHLGNEVLSAMDGGEAPFVMDLGAPGAGRPYLLLVSASGTQPGTPFGNLTLPLNQDRLLGWSLSGPNPSFWPEMNGALDAAGRAQSTLNIAPGALSPFLGGRLDFCALLPGYATAPVGFDVAP